MWGQMKLSLPHMLIYKHAPLTDLFNNAVMNIKVKTISIWLFIGPLLALFISFLSWFLINYLSPDKLQSFSGLLSNYPLGLLMSFLTPWGWLMYGGLLLMLGKSAKAGLYCTLCGAVTLGGFWPIWSTQLIGS